MKYDERKFDILLNIKQIGELIAQSADFQLEHQLDLLHEEEEESND